MAPRLTGTSKPISTNILMNTVLDKKIDEGTQNSHIERGQPIGLLLALTYNTEVV